LNELLEGGRENNLLLHAPTITTSPDPFEFLARDELEHDTTGPVALCLYAKLGDTATEKGRLVLSFVKEDAATDQLACGVRRDGPPTTLPESRGLVEAYYVAHALNEVNIASHLSQAL